MTEREEILRGTGYWLAKVQIQVFNLLNTYMEENNLTQKQVAEKLNVSPSYVSQILNGNFNFTISKLIELALFVGKAPIIQFETIEQILKAEASQMQADVKPKRRKAANKHNPASKISVN
ncbi:transcriptional regulator with XRE-family HTH domain [Dyadobacter sp. BE34]|uniref:Transcriptional regulator with XRE-family HTH domain n=1 Tax=Dyadobacter fermentans TaxID=94254 RepID=A0ABU1QPM2_9BACT|nr:MULTISPECIES: helix-turn-helix transcriptional regulator [Dyadobacter]MDR6803099.1 transcriptional regulator with XRE-family HTH domain [Dyadobacter fermentans]MDR7040841.1 transcriptional regulator with XRE-family HTH domain [Dyadobacter sp. BE242]MDR7195243.1 transcriptional regulator with XRE-family HTH domain [Dyadobacter sp. BE34]MDR7214211.1 transcriptional regulator with XRE-family HTH domain [Dyadobacter sp. BE31]MDR7260651.1 transcriptional regulator with XRE-family HTH domain [Dya